MAQGIVKRGSFPRLHFAVAGSLTLFLAAFALATYTGPTKESLSTETLALPDAVAAQGIVPFSANETTDLVLASLPLPRQPDPGAADLVGAPFLGGEVESEAEDEFAASADRTIEVRRGDSLSLIFQREGIPARDIPSLLAAEPLGKRLKNIFPGHALGFTRDDEGTLVKLTYAPGPLETLEFERQGDQFVAREVLREPDRTTAYKSGRIDHSLFVSSQRAGLPDTLTMRLAQIFQWDIDFVLDIRRGDEFHVVFEELYVDDEFIGYGEILAAEFINRGRPYRAIRYADASGRADYYTPDGKSMRKAFLRAPVEFSRISSNFNLRRIHPLFKRNIPHRGIDYAAPTGTPVLAAGDGRISTAGRSEPNGNYVIIQHGEQFTTKYLHLSKFGRGIRSGVKVRQGQIIGYVGATGWATGPHLHYEFLVHGVHQNPRTVPLPNAEPIAPGERNRFDARTGPLLAMLDNFKSEVQLALGR